MKLQFFLEAQLQSPDAAQHPALCSMKCALARVPMGLRGPGTRLFGSSVALEGPVNGGYPHSWMVFVMEIPSIFMGFGGTPVLGNFRITMNRWYQPFPNRWCLWYCFTNINSC